MDFELIKTGILVTNMIASFIIGFFFMLDRRDRVTQDAVKKLELDTNKKIDHLRDTIKDSEKKHDGEIVALHTRIDTVLHDIKEISHELGEVSKGNNIIIKQVGMMNEHLLGQTRR